MAYYSHVFGVISNISYRKAVSIIDFNRRDNFVDQIKSRMPTATYKAEFDPIDGPVDMIQIHTIPQRLEIISTREHDLDEFMYMISIHASLNCYGYLYQIEIYTGETIKYVLQDKVWTRSINLARNPLGSATPCPTLIEGI